SNWLAGIRLRCATSLSMCCWPGRRPSGRLGRRPSRWGSTRIGKRRERAGSRGAGGSNVSLLPDHQRLEDFMEPQREPHSESPTPIDPKPSDVTDKYWLYARRTTGTYPVATENSGKWLVFVSAEQVDEAWAKIKCATEEGRLGFAAKVATARPKASVDLR